MKFATRLAVIFSGIYLLSGSILTYYIYTSNVNILEEQITAKLEDIAFHTMDKVDRMLFEKYADLKLLSTDPIISSKLSSPSQVTNRLMIFMNNYTTYSSMSFFDLNRVRIADTSGISIGIQDPLVSFWTNIDNQSTFVMDIFESESPNRALFHFATVVKDENGIPFGVLVSRASLEAELYQIAYRAAGISQNGDEQLRVELVDKSGLILYSSYRPSDVLRMVSLDEDYMKELLSPQTGTVNGRHEKAETGDEIHVVAREQGYLGFRGNGWILLIHLPKSVVFAPAAQLRDRMIFILLTVGLFTLVGLFVLIHNVTKPITHLSNASAEVAKGNLDVEVESTSKDEVGQLAASFNSMVSDLRKYRDTLLGYSRELEAKVAERTAELETTNERLLIYQQDLRSLASQLSLAEEGERRRIAMDLHDQIGQKMALIMLKCETLRGSATSGDFAEPLDRLCELVGQTIQDTRSLTYEISSPILYEVGFEGAVEWLAEEAGKRYNVFCVYENDGKPKPLDNDVNVTLFRSVNELLINVAKHAKVDGLRLSIIRDGENIRIDVEDDGVGFDVSKLGPGHYKTGAYGLFSIRERVNSIGGRFEIESKPGQGTRATLLAPLKSGPSEVRVPRQLTPAQRTSGMGIRILLADDHRVLRDGLRVLLEKEPDMEVVAEAENGQEAVQLTRELRPDVVVMDVTMPELSGIEATHQIIADNSGVKVLAFSMHSNERIVTDMLQAGASGYVLKESAFDELTGAIRAVVADQTYLSPKIECLVGEEKKS